MTGRSELHSTRVLTPEGIRPANVEIRGERIHAIHDAAPSRADVDLGQAVLMPALCDCHVHINEPGRTEWEGFHTATRAAAVGGVTTLVDMPLNSDPVTTTTAALEQKLSAARGQLHVDCGFWGGVIPGNTAELPGMVRAGVLGFKAFLCDSGIDDFPMSTEADLRRAMPVLAKLGVPLLVHAELVTALTAEETPEDPTTYAAWLHSRPPRFEVDAIAMIISLVRETGCRVHIVHLSAAEALPLLRAARAEGLPITVETCPHYLCLTAEEIDPGETAYKCAPPIRGAANREGLWAGLADGTIDFVISDHSPCIPGLKRFDTGNFLEAWGGIASLQLGLANIWTEALQRGHDLDQVHRWMCREPLRFLGLSTDRGRIAAGQRADLIAWHPEQSWEISPQLIQHKHQITPYLGREVRGHIDSTWLRGTVIVEDAQPVGAPTGQVILGATT